MGDPRGTRFYHRWLRLYPEEFRWAYGWGMEHTFQERLREYRQQHGPVAVFVFMFRELLSVAVAALAQRSAETVLDVRYTLRVLTANKAFTLVTVGTLALGIGANTAVFGAVRGVLLRPLPYEDPGNLMRVYEVEPPGWKTAFSPPDFLSFQEQATLLEGFAAYDPSSTTLTGDGSPRRLSATKVTAGFFELLGTRLHRGRTFTPSEDLTGAEPVVILSHELWQGQFGGDADILGRTITLDGVARTVIGIAPAGFGFGASATDVWTPHGFNERDLALRGRHWLRVIARKRSDVSLEAAGQELETIATRLAEAYPETNSEWGAWSASLLEETVGGVRRPLLMLLGAVGLVLLIACLNVANLSLARAESRRREIAVRAALGADRGRLVRLTLVESLVLAALGGAAGLMMAYGGVRLIPVLAGDLLPRTSQIRIDVAVLVFAALATVACGVLVGLVPAIRGARQDLMSTIKDATRRWDDTGVRVRPQSVFIVSEVALSLMLVTASGLLLNSFWRITRVDPGFDQENVLTAAVSLPEVRYDDAAKRATFFEDLVTRVALLPGVESAGATQVLPLSFSYTTTIRLADHPDDNWGSVERRHITPGYFRTMGIPLLAGRTFEVGDRVGAPEVVIINEELARRAFPNERAVGKRIVWEGRTNRHDLEVIGIVGDVKAFGLTVDAEPTVYFQNAQLYPAEEMYIAVRTVGPPSSLLPALRETVEALDPSLPLQDVTTMDRIVTDSLGGQRLSTLLVGVFAVLALTLGAVGIYGVMSYVVSQRTRELGIRMALGARRMRVLQMIIRHGMMRVLIGVALGTAAVAAAGGVLRGMLFGIGPGDPATYAAVTLLILSVALIACLVPALRAARADPMEILRQD